MLPDITVPVDALLSLDRTALEGLVMHSRHLRDLINRHAGTLPLRYIHCFEITWDRVLICLNEADTDTSTLWTCEDHSEKIFHRINNAYVERLALRVSEECLRHLSHLRANVSDLQCQVRALRMSGASVLIDNDLVDFVCLQLKPQVYEMAIASGASWAF